MLNEFSNVMGSNDVTGMVKQTYTNVKNIGRE